jgi:hypothetical protein
MKQTLAVKLRYDLPKATSSLRFSLIDTPSAEKNIAKLSASFARLFEVRRFPSSLRQTIGNMPTVAFSNDYNVREGGLLPFGMLVLLVWPLIAAMWGTTR